MSAGEEKDSNTGILFTVISLVVIGLLLVAFLIPKETTTLFTKVNESIYKIFDSPFFVTAKLVAGFLTVLLSALVTWLFFKLLEMEKEHEEHVYHHSGEHTEKNHHSPKEKEEITIHTQSKTAPPPRSIIANSYTPAFSDTLPIAEKEWQSVLLLTKSTNPSDWKLAIIEADVILDKMTYMQGFIGQTLGERLTNSDPGTFKTLKYAKHVHWLRNKIAHEPTTVLTARDIQQTIRMYEAIFIEFKYI